ncbi:formylglycine-generating enzyme family protein [Candidatus Uabimicrobium sp. HlEnr_7]|uniref:formylglycine-generating enzyme family protein n=1 Tax=Candidatus Uabimicrobium helgolandensis TaxID=3095367 RepID=UPI0035590987
MKKIVKGKSLKEVEASTKYMGCTFYLDCVDGEDFTGTEFDNCSFRGWFRDWGRDEYGLWIAFTYKNVRQVMRWIRPGTFMMGSPATEDRYENEVLHQVTLSKGFWLAETECTQELWEAVMENNPSEFEGEKKPVEKVSWDDCSAFIEKLNKEVLELELCLPTEAQWEYACRAGTTTAFNFGESITMNQVNYDGRATVEVKSFGCNNWGLYEMHGNVWEWCSDWYDEYDISITTDPMGTISGSYRIVRGGSWRNFSSRHVRSAFRSRYELDHRSDYIGFRFCLRSQNKAADCEREMYRRRRSRREDIS